MELLVLLIILSAPFIFLLLSILCLRKYRRNKKKSFILLCNIVNFFFLSSLVIAGMEIYYRYFFDSTDSITITKVSQKWFRKYYITNKSGFRDNIEYQKDIEKGKKRITFLGDSFTAGQGIKVNDRFSNLIRSREPKWEIHNLSIPGWNTADEIKVIEAAIKNGYQLDIVTLVYFANDITDLNPTKDNDLQKAFRKVQSQNWFIRNSYFLDHIYFRYQFTSTPEISNYSYDVIDCYQGTIWERQKKRLLYLRKIIHNNNGKLFVVIFPYMQDVSKQIYPQENIHKALNTFLNDKNIPYLDLLETFRKDTSPGRLTLNRYDAHPNAKANILAADKIENFIKINIQ